jgi:hypothetical protein
MRSLYGRVEEVGAAYKHPKGMRSLPVSPVDHLGVRHALGLPVPLHVLAVTALLYVLNIKTIMTMTTMMMIAPPMTRWGMHAKASKTIAGDCRGRIPNVLGPRYRAAAPR